MIPRPRSSGGSDISGETSERASRPIARTFAEETPAPEKILIQAINYAPELIGCGKYTTELARYLRSRGHEIEVVTAPPHYPGWYVRRPYRGSSYCSETLDDIRVTRCPMATKAGGPGLWRFLAPLSYAITASPAVIWRIFRFRPAIVLCVEPTLFAAPVAALAAKFVGARAVLHVQDLEVDAAFGVGHLKGRQLKRLAFLLERVMLGLFDRFVTISRKMRGALIAKGLEPGRVEVLRNWVDLSVISPREREGNPFRAQLGLADDVFVALYSGHIGAKQALPVVLEAARALRERDDIRFVIAGAGPMKQRVMELSADLPNVLHLPLQPTEQLNDLLGLADLHLLPQDRGAADLVLPSKLGGMLASGRPIAATVDPGTELSDILMDIALLSPAGDGGALAGAVAQAKAQAQDMSERVARGLRLAESLSSARILPLFEQALLEERVNSAEIPVANEAA
ncbi:MAG TPA: WcaI family glycosyltransferase [Methylocystis sp.]|nr:WcaI family glycosyltransferase [Methylocystis sp.]